jgi:hypothetical protein
MSRASIAQRNADALAPFSDAVEIAQALRAISKGMGTEAQYYMREAADSLEGLWREAKTLAAAPLFLSADDFADESES